MRCRWSAASASWRRPASESRERCVGASLFPPGTRSFPGGDAVESFDCDDYFLYTPDVYDELPPFAVGRFGFDNWLIWKARDRGAVVIDATPSVRGIHQRHDYSHLAGGGAVMRTSDEANRNLRLIGSKSRLYTRYDATHVLGRGRLRRNALATFRLKENARKALYKLRVHTPWPPRDHVQAQQ